MAGSRYFQSHRSQRYEEKARRLNGYVAAYNAELQRKIEALKEQLPTITSLCGDDPEQAAVMIASESALASTPGEIRREHDWHPNALEGWRGRWVWREAPGGKLRLRYSAAADKVPEFVPVYEMRANGAVVQIGTEATHPSLDDSMELFEEYRNKRAAYRSRTLIANQRHEKGYYNENTL